MTDDAQANASQTLLIVDDDPVFSQVLARAMSKRGFSTLTAPDVESAEALAREHVPNHATVDLKMEGPSGLTLIPKLLAINPQLKIVILTGYSSISTAVEAIKLGAVNYLCKPADADEILTAFEQQTGNPDQAIPDQPMSVDRLTWEHIQRVLQENNGNISATARSLGMHRRTLQRKLQKRPVKR